jgi:putative inorganic carbon (hco3(-)) transporter
LSLERGKGQDNSMLFIGLILFIFLIFVQPQEFVPVVKGMPLVAIVLEIIGVGWIFRILSSHKKHIVDSPQNKLMFVFWVAMVLSTLPVQWASYTHTVFIKSGKLLLMYLFMVNIIDSFKKFKIIIVTITLSMFITAAMGILQYYGIDITGIGTQLGNRIRGVGIFDTNQLAYSCAFCVPLGFCLLLHTKKLFVKVIYVFILTGFTYCIYLTQSRGGAICLVFTVFLLFMFFSKSKFTKIAGLISTGLILMVFIALSGRLATVSQYQTDESAMNRLYVWGEALYSFKSNFLLGVGPGLFVENFHMAAHSSYLEILSELGLVGMYVWLAFFYFSMRNLNYMIRSGFGLKNEQLTLFSKSILISIYAFLMGSLFSSNSYYITLYIIFSLVVILQYISGDECMKKCSRSSIQDLSAIGAIEIAVIIFLHFWIKLSA